MPRPLTGLSRHYLVTELVAGVTLLAIAVPLNIGYAQIAGMPPTAGLYALIVPGIVYALVASTRQVVASPDAAASALVASSQGGLAVAGSGDFITLAFAQAILCGVFRARCRCGPSPSFRYEYQSRSTFGPTRSSEPTPRRTPTTTGYSTTPH